VCGVVNVKLASIALVAATTIALSACAGGPAASPSADSFSGFTPDTTSIVDAGSLRIAPFDLLSVQVFGVEDLSGEYQVDPDGQIKLPLIGAIDAKGRTIFELSNIVEARLGESYLQEPQVSIRVSEAYGQQVTVEGAVSKPGVYPVRGNLSLLQALALGGGTTSSADLSKVYVFRTVEGARRVGGFDISRIRKGEAPDPPVYGNDVIVVEGSLRTTAWQEFLRAVPLLGLFVYYR
jgi:polysaccharide export outer membrane protein